MYNLNIERALIGLDIANELEESGLGSMRTTCPRCGDYTLSVRHTEAGNISYLCYHSSCSERGITKSGPGVREVTTKSSRPLVHDPLRINTTQQILEDSPLHKILAGQFSITKEEIINNNIRQSTLDEMSAVFTILDGVGTPTGSVDRNYNGRKPKTINKLCTGVPSGRHYAHTPAPITSLRTVVIVEDIVSAICCVRNPRVASVALLGTHMQLSLMTELADKFDNIIIFLDADASLKSSAMVDLCMPFFKGKVSLCYDTFDPKDIATERLVSILDKYLQD